MARATKIGNNDPCPCGSSTKFKYCCKGKVDWETLILSANGREYASHLTIRGKNINFVSAIFEALQIDSDTSTIPFAHLKRAFTPKVVEKIHHAIMDLWPDR